MARPGPQTMAKRQREQKKREKRLAKKEKMALRRAQKTRDGSGPPVGFADEPGGAEAGAESGSEADQR